jgi:hypothetical protein
MTLRACAHEKEVTALVLRGQWPAASPAELRAHVEGCRACGDLVLVMQAFQGARAESSRAAQPASAGVLWWRAQLRRRKAAVERVGRPILGAQIFALSITLLLAAGFVASQARHGLQWLSWFSQLPKSPTFHLESLWPSALAMPQWGMMLAVSGAVALALLGGLALYLNSERQ